MNSVRNIFLFVPGLSQKFQTGGLIVARDVVAMLEELGHNTHIVATHEEHPHALTPDRAFEKVAGAPDGEREPIFIVTWGPLVEKHIKMIRQRTNSAQIVYYAQSFGWGISIPADVPIVCVSRFVMAQWALYGKANVVSYIPPTLHDVFLEHAAEDAAVHESERTIDVLVHERKQNAYCLKELVPALKNEGLRVELIRGWIPQRDFAEKLLHTRIFLYLTALHKAGWRRRLPGEGFGLPALEAVSSGCVVASNLLGGVTDFLTPGRNAIALSADNVDQDVTAVKNAVAHFAYNPKRVAAVQNEYRRSVVRDCWKEWLASC